MCEKRMGASTMDGAGIIEALKRLGVPHDRIAEAIGRDRTAATKMLAGKRSIKVTELEPLSRLIAEFEVAAGEAQIVRRADPLADQLQDGALADYVPIEVLPTFAGMGGGGTGDDERRMALLPRALVEDELKASPSDLIVINVRGDSMEPDFYQGDQILADRRDTSPTQPGPFALWDGDGYVLKNVERIRRTGKLRIFSSNSRYREDEVDPDDVRILGRPVWFARRV